MAFGGDVDTLALMFDKLQYIFRGYDSYAQSITEMHALYKQAKLSEREFFHGITDAVLKYSALEFLALKAMFEIKKSLNRKVNPSIMASAASVLLSGNLSEQTIPGPQNSIASFITAKTLPGRNEFTQTEPGNQKICSSCGKMVSSLAKFCKSCGNKV
jgi:hypothetical protein